MRHILVTCCLSTLCAAAAFGQETAAPQAEQREQGAAGKPAKGLVEGDPAREDGHAEVVVEAGRLKVKAGKNDRVAVGDSVVIEANEEVADAVAVGGSLTVRGKVLGDAVAVGGRLKLEPGAVVMGDAVAVGGGLEVAPSATLHGNRVNVGGSLGEWISGAVGWGDEDDTLRVNGAPLGDTLWGWLKTIGVIIRAVMLLLFGSLIVAFAPERVARTQDFLTRDPIRSGLAGVALVIAFVPLCVLLAVTIIGLPAIPIVVVVYAFLWVAGAAVLATWLGNLLPTARSSTTSFAALLTGMVALILLGFLPLGGLILFGLAMIPAGAIVLSRFGDERFVPARPA